MKSEKMTPLLQSMWLQVLWILWTLWFVLDPAWDLFASGVEWLLSMGVLGWFLGLVALALAVSAGIGNSYADSTPTSIQIVCGHSCQR